VSSIPKRTVKSLQIFKITTKILSSGRCGVWHTNPRDSVFLYRYLIALRGISLWAGLLYELLRQRLGSASAGPVTRREYARLTTRGKPSTWIPRGELVEQTGICSRLFFVSVRPSSENCWYIIIGVHDFSSSYFLIIMMFVVFVRSSCVLGMCFVYSY